MALGVAASGGGVREDDVSATGERWSAGLEGDGSGNLGPSAWAGVMGLYEVVSCSCFCAVDGMSAGLVDLGESFVKVNDSWESWKKSVRVDGDQGRREC